MTLVLSSLAPIRTLKVRIFAFKSADLIFDSIFSDILIAGEPTIMGGLADDDERPITRIENIENQDPQLDQTAVKSERD